MKRLLLLVALMLLALFLAAGAISSTGFQVWWTTDKAEQAVFDSSWADQHNIVLVSCEGAGRPKLDALGNPTFYRFSCQGEYDTENYGDAFTCVLTFAVRPLTDTRFSLVGGNNPDCLPVQGYVLGN